MKLWRWFGALAVLAGFMFVAAATVPTLAGGKDAQDKKGADKKGEDKKGEEKDKAKPDDKSKDKTKPEDKTKPDDKSKVEPKPGDAWVWKAFEKPFYQKLVTTTVQKMKVMNQEITQNQTQTFFILWSPKDEKNPKNKDGNWVVTQKIEGVKMKIDIGGNTISFDSTQANQPPNPMTDFFNALMKLELTMTIDPKTMKIVGPIEGRNEFVDKLSATNPQMTPLLKSILSEDALKAMAEPTWGAFPPDGNPNKPWNKPSSLNLGPIGQYETKFDYTYEGTDPKEKAEKVSIKAELTYKAPVEKGGLPFTIQDAKLKSTSGSGVAYFDKTKGRFTKSEMNMKLEGNLKIEVGGMATDVTLTQTQDAVVDTMDERPGELPTATKKQ